MTVYALRGFTYKDISDLKDSLKSCYFCSVWKELMTTNTTAYQIKYKIVLLTASSFFFFKYRAFAFKFLSFPC